MLHLTGYFLPEGMFFILLRALRMETLPRPSIYWSGTRKNEQLSRDGATSSSASITCPTGRARKEKGARQEAARARKGTRTPSVFSGWAFHFGAHPTSLIPWLNRKTENITGLSPTLFPHPTPALFLSFLSFFLSQEPSERQQGARFPPFLTIGH